MFKENGNKSTIYFGYGSVLVGSTIGIGGDCPTADLNFTHIAPPAKVGEKPQGEFEVLGGWRLRLSEEDLYNLSVSLSKVNEHCNSITLECRESDGVFVLDFSNYNPKSVKVISKVVYKTLGAITGAKIKLKERL